MSETTGFVWYDLMTTDLEGAIRFYKEVVGWTIRDSGTPGVRYEIFGPAGKDVGGMVQWPPERAGMPPMWVGHVGVKDAKAATDAVVTAGGAVHRSVTEIPGVGWFSVVADPQGAGYQLFQPNEQYAKSAPPRPVANEVGGVGWHELHTTDWEKAWEFYASQYGWTKQNAVDMGPMGTYQTFMMQGTPGGGGMMNLPKEMAGVPPGWLLYFTVDAADAAKARIEQAGGTVTAGPHEVPGGMWIVMATDPQGARFAVVAEKR